MKRRPFFPRFMHAMSNIVTVVFGVFCLGTVGASVAGLIPPRSEWTKEQTDLFGSSLLIIFALMWIFVVIPAMIPVLFPKKKKPAPAVSASRTPSKEQFYSPQPIPREDGRLVLMAGEFIWDDRPIQLIADETLSVGRWYTLTVNGAGQPVIRYYQVDDRRAFSMQIPEAFLLQGSTVAELLQLCGVSDRRFWRYEPDTLVSFERHPE